MSTCPSPVAPSSPRRIYAFLAAEALSAVGSWAVIVAIWGYAAYEYGAGPADVALFGLMFAGPGVLLGPVSGTVIDRVGPKRTLAVAKASGVVASLALLAADDFRSLALLSAAHGVVSTFTHTALQSMPPRLVDDDRLARTNALVSLTDELAIVAGPVAAGVGIAAFGFRGAFVFDAVTYAVGLFVLPLVRLKPVEHAPGSVEGAAEPRVGWRDALDGWRLVARTGILRRTVACTFAVHVLYGFALLAEPLYVRDVLERPEEVFAALQTVFGVFLVIGGLVATRLGDRLATFGWIAAGVGGSGVAAVVYLGTPYVAVAFAGVAVWGVVTALISGPSRTVLQRSSPVAVHGRVLSTDFVAGSAAELTGIAAAGLLIAAFGVPWAVLAAASVVVVVAVSLDAADRRDRRSASPTEPVALASVD
ncbi:MAG: MFS transporter [Actinomycetota bacterium]|nr:MFS transporter [Actinomycetota bacterium]